MRDCDDSGTRAARVRGFRLYYEGETLLRVQDLWPDGDAPENPTVADVRALMRAEGPDWKVIREWALDHDVVISVDRVLAREPADETRVRELEARVRDLQARAREPADD